MFDQQHQTQLPMEQQHQQFRKTSRKNSYASKKLQQNTALFARFGGDDPFENFLPPPPPPPQKSISKIRRQKYNDDEEKCIEFICVPSSKTPPPSDKLICPEPKCPPGYNLILDQVANPKQCTTFDCQPQRLRDSICNVTGRTFNTFDNIEYKYDICSHVLAREVSSGNWTIVCEYPSDPVSLIPLL